MINQDIEVGNGPSLGLKFHLAIVGGGNSITDDVAEYAKVSGRGDLAILEDANDTNIYRTGLPDVWDQLARALFAQTAIPKLTKPHHKKERADKGDVVVNESDVKYVNRVMAAQNMTLADIQKIVDSFGVVPVDYTERRGKGGFLAKQDLAMAATYLDAGEEKCNKALAAIAEFTGMEKVELTGERETDIRNIALAIKAYKEASPKGLLK